MERPGEKVYEKSPKPQQAPGLQEMWGMETATDCECPGPPPEFLLPPPPRPAFLQPTDPTFCTEDTLPIETCEALPLIDASYRSNPSFQTSAVIVLCSVLLGLFVFIIVIVVWKHKRKVQNFLPCKTSPQNNCDGPAGPGVIYEDLHDVLPRSAHHHHHHHHHQYNHPAGGRIAPTIEMIDVKNNIHYPSGYPISQHPPVFLCSSPGPDPYSSQDLYNPVYEELSDDSDLIAARTLSEDEFAEDELSLSGGVEQERRRVIIPSYVSAPQSMRRFRRPHEPLPPLPNGNKRNRTLDRRRQEFHEGMLLDALLQLYPRVGGVEHPPITNRRQGSGGSTGQSRGIPSIDERIQSYETSVPVLGHLASFHRPKPCSQDSAFGSDSSYSNNHTLRGSRRDPRRLSQLSADLALT